MIKGVPIVEVLKEIAVGSELLLGYKIATSPGKRTREPELQREPKRRQLKTFDQQCTGVEEALPERRSPKRRQLNTFDRQCTEVVEASPERMQVELGSKSNVVTVLKRDHEAQIAALKAQQEDIRRQAAVRIQEAEAKAANAMRQLETVGAQAAVARTSAEQLQGKKLT